MNEVYSWAVAKQYLAAHYYLSEERPICISEAQRAQLGGLHLYVSFGPYNDSLEVPELINCTAAERKKRVSEWKRLGLISRETAMRRFIDLITNLFPNWFKFRKLYYEFEMDWLNMPEIPTKKKPQAKPAASERDRKKWASRENTPAPFKKIEEMKKVRNRRAKSRTDQVTNSDLFMSKRSKMTEEDKSKIPKVEWCVKKYAELDDDFLKNFVEDLQSYRGGNLRRTSATKMPKGFERQEFDDCGYFKKDRNFKKELDLFRKQLVIKDLVRISEKEKSENREWKMPSVREKLNKMRKDIDKIEKEYEELDFHY